MRSEGERGSGPKQAVTRAAATMIRVVIVRVNERVFLMI
jgi:hypothetical protein